VKIKLYIEGGGDSKVQDVRFREGWSTFFENAGLQGKMPATFRGGGRDQTFKAFCTAVRTRKENELPLLLVDSEEPIGEAQSEWQHLQNRDCWEQPQGAGDDDAYLMIQCMESWFVADRAALQRFFHNCWRDNALPQWANPESVPKQGLLQALENATADCGRRKYSKGEAGFKLLKEIDPELVEEKCPGAKRLLDRLRAN